MTEAKKSKADELNEQASEAVGEARRRQKEAQEPVLSPEGVPMQSSGYPPSEPVSPTPEEIKAAQAADVAEAVQAAAKANSESQAKAAKGSSQADAPRSASKSS